MSASLYLKGLHGIRAIAAIAVVISHINQNLSLIGLKSKGVLDIAGYGVTMFFALSGFLITYLLLLEKDKTGYINIRNFYIRRILRIWPLYFLYLLIAIIVFYLLLPQNINNNLWWYFLFMPNILQVTGGGINYIGHFWSLGVEEHFYAFWPWLFRRTIQPIQMVIVFLVGYFSLRVLGWYLDISDVTTIPYLIIDVNRFDCMAMGGLGACLFHKKNEVFLSIIYSKIAQLICWSILMLLALNQYHLSSLLDQQVISVVVLVIILNGIGNKERVLSLENKLMIFLGKISFGIYVFHPILIFLFSLLLKNLLWNDVFKEVSFYGLVLGTTILISYLSYHFFEKRFLLLKSKYNSAVPSTIEPQRRKQFKVSKQRDPQS